MSRPLVRPIRSPKVRPGARNLPAEIEEELSPDAEPPKPDEPLPDEIRKMLEAAYT